MTRMEETEALRARTDVHYNCCQSVLVPFADLCGLDKETAFKLGANFGSGMRHGSTCGAVTGALMVLGLAGKGADEATALMRRFREKNQVLDCANLLRLAKERGGGAQVPLRPDGIRSGGASGGLAEIRRSGTGCWPVPDNVRALLQGEDDGDFKGGAAGGKEFHGDDVPVAVLNGVLFNEIPLGNGRFIGVFRQRMSLA